MQHSIAHFQYSPFPKRLGTAHGSAETPVVASDLLSLVHRIEDLNGSTRLVKPTKGIKIPIGGKIYFSGICTHRKKLVRSLTNLNTPGKTGAKIHLRNIVMDYPQVAVDHGTVKVAITNRTELINS